MARTTMSIKHTSEPTISACTCGRLVRGIPGDLLSCPDCGGAIRL